MKHTKSTTNSRFQRINEISKEILALTEELNTLLLQDQASDPVFPRQGDPVILTSQNLYGAKAQIIGVTEKRFVLRLEDGRIVYRAKHNVTLP
mmetsp:Transcript_14399/g.27059  ORF Transcript_14399/g.27059 Transcript_14399/m.27059 type:complete len:93 (-) Transcript_14399:1217-1495(-)